MRIGAALATFVAGTALACVVAYWGWQLLGPSSAPIPATGPSNPAAALIAANLFGGTAAPSSPSGPGVSVLGGDTRLLGIIVEAGQRGYALFRSPGGAKLVTPGQEVASGVTLVSVQTDAVTIRDGAGERRFALRENATDAGRGAVSAAATTTRAVAAPTRTAATATATCGPPSGFGGTVVRLNTELLGGIGADSPQWRALLAPVSGGLVVREDNGFAAMLGLKTGDRIAQANGIALGVPDDVTAAIVRPLVANQGVRLIGSRNGTTQELWLANVACAG
jgi:hypothetical protein